MKTLKIEDLSKNFGTTEVLKKINLDIDEGNFLVLLGPSGCGKSTLLNIIAGLETINEGNVYIDDYNVSKVEPKDRNIAMVFQSYALYPSMNVKENMIFGLKQAKASKEKIEEQLKKVSSFLKVDELLNRKPNRHLPYVGGSAFSHKGGLHVSAVQKDPKTYEHIEPKLVGNQRNIVVSDQSGKSNIISRLKSIGVEFKEDDPKIKKLLDEVKDREFIGYSYDGADASFELLARRLMGEIPRYISIKEYDVSVKKDKLGNIISSAKAHLEVDKKIILCEGEGNGPVHALDNAIRNNVDKIAKYSQYLKDLKLVDYKVRILNTGTEAVTRVSIESTDSKGKNWFTIGVSTNIIDASFKALVDSLDYKLFKDNAPASI